MKDNYKDLNVQQKKSFWKENQLNGDIDITIDGITPFKMKCNNDDTVVKDLYWTNFKGWEYTSLIIWNKLSKLNGDIVLDIGSYSGIYSIIASLNNNKIYTFDIMDACIERVKYNKKLNNLSKINVINKAVSDTTGVVTIHYNEEDGIMSSISSLKQTNSHKKTKQIESIKIDDYINDKVGLIKIDVENIEVSVLNSMKRTIMKYMPDILIEINYKNKLNEIINTIPNDYNIYQIDDINQNITSDLSKSLGRNYLLTLKNENEIL